MSQTHRRRELGTAEENLGGPLLSPRISELSAAEEYSEPRPGPLRMSAAPRRDHRDGHR